MRNKEKYVHDTFDNKQVKADIDNHILKKTLINKPCN